MSAQGAAIGSCSRSTHNFSFITLASPSEGWDPSAARGAMLAAGSSGESSAASLRPSPWKLSLFLSSARRRPMKRSLREHRQAFLVAKHLPSKSMALPVLPAQQHRCERPLSLILNALECARVGHKSGHSSPRRKIRDGQLAEKVVGRDGIEPPTPGFSVLMTS